MNWINGNIPEKKAEYYWIAIKNCTCIETYYQPVRYMEKRECWVDFNGNQLSSRSIVAYCPIQKPKDYNVIGNGTGFYIQTKYLDNKSIYGFGLQFANWCGRGYSTKEKALAAAKRLVKLDEKENYVRDSYCVVDGYGNLITIVKEKCL